MNLKNIVKFELIGLTMEITEAKNKSLIGLKGKIIDETRNMLTLDTKKGIKKLIKSQVKLKMKFKNNSL